MDYIDLDHAVRKDMILNHIKYTHINGKAYTVDGCLVYTICLEIDKFYLTLSPESISKRLKAFALANIEESRGSATQIYLVTFKRAEDACKVLLQPFPYFGNAWGFTVNAAHSWQQPFTEQLYRKRFDVYEGPIDPEESPIFKLNQDCLLHLYRYLGLMDQYNLSRLCSRFDIVFRSQFNRKLKHMLIDEHSWVHTLLEWRELLNEYGHFVETIRMVCSIINDMFKELVAVYCSNLQSLEINQSGQCPIKFFENIEHFKKIHTIKLIAVNLEERHLHYFRRIRSLEHLDVSFNFSITGTTFDSFANLKELNIEGCSNIRQAAFISMCGKLSKLTALNITECESISNDAILEMSLLCQNLRELAITNVCGRNLVPILELPNLEKLHLQIGRNVSENLFVELPNKLKAKLKVLSITLLPIFSQTYLTNTLKECICQVTALEELYLRMACANDEFVRSISSLPNLRSFEATSCNSLTVGAMLDFIRNAPKLERLTLVNNRDWKDCYRDFILSAIDILKQRPSGKAFVLCIKYSDYSHLREDCKECVRSHRGIINIKKLP